MFPKTTVLPIVTSTLSPVNALRAGIVVTAATRQTKMKLAFDFIKCGSIGIAIIPTTGNSMPKENNIESDIDIRYSDYAGFWLL